MMSLQISAFNSKTMLKLQNTYKGKTETRTKKNISKIRPKKLNNVRNNGVSGLCIKPNCMSQSIATCESKQAAAPNYWHFSHVVENWIPPKNTEATPSMKTKFKTISNATSFCAARE
ncbi:hypothetical protein PanWU01x14_052100 [Parasponia andersonii]|uniref:Uncharacterized protein n=1 Tax=Parasponia andersonii TaxID=3476 RepID=A0A2P5DM65_PARAD|nr:hypothetical protein PanWU01x14_052100 [Parasponia andersonii]